MIIFAPSADTLAVTTCRDRTSWMGSQRMYGHDNSWPRKILPRLPAYPPALPVRSPVVRSFSWTWSGISPGLPALSPTFRSFSLRLNGFSPRVHTLSETFHVHVIGHREGAHRLRTAAHRFRKGAHRRRTGAHRFRKGAHHLRKGGIGHRKGGRRCRSAGKDQLNNLY